MIITHSQILPTRLVLRAGNATGIEDVSDSEVASTDATYTCRTTGVLAVRGDCSP